MDGDCSVMYVSSGLVAPLNQLYFCRHCVELRSRNCVLHEVDSSFCPNCLENMTPADAKLKKNRCRNCFECPCCGQILTIRITLHNITPETPKIGKVDNLDMSAGEEGGVKQTKSYYMGCAHCRWNTRDSGIPDSPTVNGFQERGSEMLDRIGQLIEYYREIAIEEIQEREKKRSRRRSYFQTAEKHGYSPFAFKHKAKAKVDEGNIGFNPSEASSTIEPLTDEFFTKPVVLEEITNMKQRLMDTEQQPIEFSSIFPQRKLLQVKQSQRCKYCDHNLIKPEYHAVTYKFKINMSAVFHIPEIKILSKPLLKPGQENIVILTLRNPLDHDIQVKFNPLEDNDLYVNSKVILPTEELTLQKCDEVTRLDIDQNQLPSPEEDDAKLIAFRKGNKIGFYITVIPNDSNENVTFGFIMEHNIQISVDSRKETTTRNLIHRIIVNLGPIDATHHFARPSPQSPKQRLGTYGTGEVGNLDKAQPPKAEGVNKGEALLRLATSEAAAAAVAGSEVTTTTTTPTTTPDAEAKPELFASVKKLFAFSKGNKG